MLLQQDREVSEVYQEVYQKVDRPRSSTMIMMTYAMAYLTIRPQRAAAEPDTEAP